MPTKPPTSISRHLARLAGEPGLVAEHREHPLLVVIDNGIVLTSK